MDNISIVRFDTIHISRVKGIRSKMSLADGTLYQQKYNQRVGCCIESNKYFTYNPLSFTIISLSHKLIIRCNNSGGGVMIGEKLVS